MVIQVQRSGIPGDMILEVNPMGIESLPLPKYP